MKYFVLLYCFLGLSKYSLTQNLLNGDLEGVVTDVSQLPQYWEAIPFDDPLCLATHPATATPDLTTIDGPLVGQGVFGFPSSGNSFVSGGFGSVQDISTEEVFIYHEGIRQLVVDWIPGCEYKLSFSQTVVKQLFNGGGAIDSSGYWKVFLDNDFQERSPTVVSNIAFDSEFLLWQNVELIVVPTKDVQYLQFLPFDNDSNIKIEDYEGIRMGIDNIILEPTNICYSAIEMPNVFSPNGDGVNDVFSPVSIYGIGEYLFTIVNRWGITVYESNNPAVVWDGGKAEEGTYFWKVNYSDLEGRKLEQQGFLTLIR